MDEKLMVASKNKRKFGFWNRPTMAEMLAPLLERASTHCHKCPSCKCPEDSVRPDCPGVADIRNKATIQGEHLKREADFENAFENRPCIVSPSHFVDGLTVAVILIAIFAALWAANAAQAVPV